MKILAQNSCSVSLWHGVVGPVLRSALISALKHGTNTQFGRPRPLPVRPGRALPRIFSGGSDGLSSPPMPASINSDINPIHQAYCEATEYNVPLMPYFERQWFEALKCGLTCDCVKLVIKERL